MNTQRSFSNSTCREQILRAERELSAFVSAVTELFGPEQAKLSAEGVCSLVVVPIFVGSGSIRAPMRPMS